MQAININVGEIKCDNPDCDFRDETAKFENYEAWLNKPCPQCGANLLTEADLKTVQTIVSITTLINWVLRPFVKLIKNPKRTAITGEMNGTGQVTFRPEE